MKNEPYTDKFIGMLQNKVEVLKEQLALHIVAEAAMETIVKENEELKEKIEILRIKVKADIGIMNEQEDIVSKQSEAIEVYKELAEYVAEGLEECYSCDASEATEKATNILEK